MQWPVDVVVFHNSSHYFYFAMAVADPGEGSGGGGGGAAAHLIFSEIAHFL